MKVKELIELLKQQPQELPVLIVMGDDEIAWSVKSVDKIPADKSEGTKSFVQLWGGDTE